MLDSIAKVSPLATSKIVIKAPYLYLFDRKTNIQVLEDFHDTSGFKSMLFSPNASTLLPHHSLAVIGRHLGSWLRSFHTWASAPEQATLRAQMWQNDPMRKMKHDITYGGSLTVLENYPELLDGHRMTLEAIRDSMIKQLGKVSTEEDEDWGLLHGDFWSGK